MTKLRWTAVTLAALVGLSLVAPRGVAAARFHVRARTVGQGYRQITSDRGLLNRRRLSQSLTLGVHDLTNDDSDRLALVTALRVDSDFALSQEEADRTRELDNHQLTLMLGYVEGRHLVPWTTVRAGRQMLVDPASGFLLLDGLRVDVETPWFVGAELVSGVESRAGVITDAALELDGGEEHGGPVVVLGGALTLDGLYGVDARVDYQRWLREDAVEREVVAGSLWWRAGRVLSLGGDVRWDLFSGVIDSARANVRVSPWRPLRLDASYERYVPVFRATSIFNVFAADAYDEVRGVATLDLGGRVTLRGGGGVRIYGADGLVGGALDAVLRGGLTVRAGRATVIEADYVQEGKSGGSFRWVDVALRHAFSGDRVGLDGRITVYHQEDPLRSDATTTVFGAQLGGWFQVRDVARVHLLFEDNESSRHRHALRFVAMVDLDLWML